MERLHKTPRVSILLSYIGSRMVVCTINFVYTHINCFSSNTYTRNFEFSFRRCMQRCNFFFSLSIHRSLFGRVLEQCCCAIAIFIELFSSPLFLSALIFFTFFEMLKFVVGFFFCALFLASVDSR